MVDLAPTTTERTLAVLITPETARFPPNLRNATLSDKTGRERPRIAA
jgi:hypothetical protein